MPRYVRHRTTSGLLALTMLLAAGASPGAAQTPSEPASPAPTGIAAGPCGLGDDLAVRLGRVQVMPYFTWRSEDPRTELAEREVDVLAEQDILVTVTYDDASGTERSVPIDSLQATLTLGALTPVWLVTSSQGTTGSIRVPAGARGSGVLAYRLGLCDGWATAGASPITVSDPAGAVNCPTDVDGLQAYVDALDRRTRVGAKVVPTFRIPNARTRYADVRLGDSGSYAGYTYDPATPVVRTRPGARIHVRPVVRDMHLADAGAYVYEVPPAAQLRDGFVMTLQDTGFDTRPRLDGEAVSLRMPSRRGRYLLIVSGRWRDPCIDTEDAALLVLIDVR